MAQTASQANSAYEKNDDYNECQGLLMCPLLFLFPCQIYDMPSYFQGSNNISSKDSTECCYCCSYNSLRNSLFFSLMIFQHPLYAALQSGSSCCMCFSWYCLCGQYYLDTPFCMQPSPFLSPPSIKGYEFLKSNDVNINRMSSSSCISSDDFKCGTNYSMLYSSILFKYEIAGLHYAKYLIDNGCDVNAINSSGDTVIHQIAKHSRKRFIKPKDHQMSRGRHLKLDLKYLIDVGCDLNAVNTRGKTALHYCIKEIDPSTTKYLIEMGADFNIQDADNLNTYEYAFRDFDETPSDNKIDIYFEDAAGSLYTENIKDIDVTFVNGHSDIDSKSNFLADYIASVTYKETSSQKPPLPNDRIVHLFKIIMILLENGANFYENPEFLEKKPMWFKSLIIKCKNELSKRNSNDSKTKFQPVKLSIEVAKLTRYFHENCGIEPANSSKYANSIVCSCNILDYKQLRSIYQESREQFNRIIKEIRMSNDDFELLLQTFF